MPEVNLLRRYPRSKRNIGRRAETKTDEQIRLSRLSALREMERLAPGRGYVQVDSYRTPEERELFLDWVLTAHTHDYPQGRLQLSAEAGYTGAYYWTL